MLLPTPSVTLPSSLGPWFILIALGAYHGVNPGMGWLFALSLGIQRQSEKAVWLSLFPIAAGHAASIGLVGLILLAGLQYLSLTVLQWITVAVLIAFGIYKLFNYYRHPRWVGMKVKYRDLFAWSFLMATAHGSGLMVAPVLLGLNSVDQSHRMAGMAGMSQEVEMAFAVGAHTAAMFLVMGAVAWLVYKKFGLSVLKQSWFNFDLLWAVALLLAGGIALVLLL